MITCEDIKNGEFYTKRNFLTHKESTDFWYLTHTCTWEYGNVSNTYSNHRQRRMTRPFDINEFVKTDLWQRIDALFDKVLSVGKAYINFSDHATVNLPHCDGDNPGPTIMICLNQEWKKDWGGYTVVYKSMHEDDIEFASVPEPGKLIIFNGGKWHSGQPVAHFAEYPRFMLTLHCFLDKENK